MTDMSLDRSAGGRLAPGAQRILRTIPAMRCSPSVGGGALSVELSGAVGVAKSPGPKSSLTGNRCPAVLCTRWARQPTAQPPSRPSQVRPAEGRLIADEVASALTERVGSDHVITNRRRGALATAPLPTQRSLRSAGASPTRKQRTAQASALPLQCAPWRTRRLIASWSVLESSAWRWRGRWRSPGGR